MTVFSGDLQGAAPVPAMPFPAENNRIHVSSISSSSSSVSDGEQERGRSRTERPRMASRKPSASILVPRDHPEIEIEEEEFPPDDARAMSPRRDSADVERLGKEARQTLQEWVIPRPDPSSRTLLANRSRVVDKPAPYSPRCKRWPNGLKKSRVTMTNWRTRTDFYRTTSAA
jgi:hypothetical protein